MGRLDRWLHWDRFEALRDYEAVLDEIGRRRTAATPDGPLSRTGMFKSKRWERSGR